VTYFDMKPFINAFENLSDLTSPKVPFTAAGSFTLFTFFSNNASLPGRYTSTQIYAALLSLNVSLDFFVWPSLSFIKKQNKT